MDNDSKTKLVKAKAMPKSTVNVSKETLSKVSDFYYKFVDAIGGGDKDNIAVSPVSAFLVLAMAAECAAGQTRQEILDAMGIKMSELKEIVVRVCSCLNRSLDDDTCIVKSLNSIWASNRLDLKEEKLAELSEHYCCDIFKTDFANDDAEKKIIKLIKEETNGLLNIKPNFKDNLSVVFMNVIYIKETWNEMAKNLKSYGKVDFLNSDKTTITKNFYCGDYCSGRVKTTEKCRKFYTTTCSGFKLTFVVPKEDYTVNDVYNSECLAENEPYITEDKSCVYSTRCIFPLFEASFGGSIKTGLQNIGIHHLFNDSKSDFSNFANDLEGKIIYIQDIEQFTKFRVSRKGIEASAVTSMMGLGLGLFGIFEQVYEDFIVDRAFAYKFEDEHGNVLFSGVVNKLD